MYGGGEKRSWGATALCLPSAFARYVSTALSLSAARFRGAREAASGLFPSVRPSGHCPRYTPAHRSYENQGHLRQIAVAPAYGGKLPRPFPAYFAGVARKTLAPSARHTSTAWTTSPNGAVPSACSTTGLSRRACCFSSASEAWPLPAFRVTDCAAAGAGGGTSTASPIGGTYEAFVESCWEVSRMGALTPAVRSASSTSITVEYGARASPLRRSKVRR